MLVRWGFLFVTIIIVFSVAFEMGVEYIKEAVNEDMEEVVSALLEELTTLGFLGFAFFLFTVPIDDGESLIQPSLIEATIARDVEGIQTAPWSTAST